MLAADTAVCVVAGIQIGRFVIGLGGESLSVAQGALVVEWFLNEEIGAWLGPCWRVVIRP